MRWVGLHILGRAVSRMTKLCNREGIVQAHTPGSYRSLKTSGSCEIWPVSVNFQSRTFLRGTGRSKKLKNFQLFLCGHLLFSSIMVVYTTPLCFQGPSGKLKILVYISLTEDAQLLWPFPLQKVRFHKV